MQPMLALPCCTHIVASEPRNCLTRNVEPNLDATGPVTSVMSLITQPSHLQQQVPEEAAE